MSDPFDFLPNDWSAVEKDLWGAFDGFGALDDPVAQTLFNEGYFEPGAWNHDQIVAIREELDRYMLDEYGIDFSEIFDWDAWREAYEDA